MTFGFRKFLALSASAAAFVVMASAANASSFAIRAGQSAEGLGMAFAGAASGGIGMGSQAWNPATMTMFPGRTSNWNATYLLPQARYNLDGPATLPGLGGAPITAGGGTQAGSAQIGLNGAFIPASYNVWQITDRLFIGLSNTAPFGLRSKPGGTTGYWAGQTYGRSATIRTVNVAPAVAFKINDWVSIGAALQIQYVQVDLKQALGLTANANQLQLRGDSYDLGYRLGITLTPFEGTNIGIAYRSGFDHGIKGKGRVAIPAAATTIETPVRLNLPLPGSVVLGLSQKINDQWQVHLGLEWTNWKRFGSLPVFNANTGAQYALPGAPPTPVTLRFNYKDSWFFSGGVEYKYNQALTLRAGVGYELSAIDDSTRSPLISDNDRLWLSAGFSYQLTNKMNMDFGYTFINVNKARIRYAPGTQNFSGVALSATAEPKIHIFSLGLTYRWDDPTVAQSVVSKAAPISVRN
jgi:long-chain fatty acid transport protein